MTAGPTEPPEEIELPPPIVVETEDTTVTVTVEIDPKGDGRMTPEVTLIHADRRMLDSRIACSHRSYGRVDGLLPREVPGNAASSRIFLTRLPKRLATTFCSWRPNTRKGPIVIRSDGCRRVQMASERLADVRLQTRLGS